MSEQQYDIIFRGDIVLGQQLADVKLRLQQLFKADAAKIDSLFSGRPVPLKRSLDLSSAQKYRDALINAGAQVELVASVNAAVVAPVINKPVATAASTAIPPATNKTPEQQAPQTQTIGNWSLAPVGTYLLPVTDKPAVVQSNIDTSAISLRPEGGNLLDVSEQAPAITAPVIVPDFRLAEVGADLVRAEEKVALPLVEIDVGDWDIAELGADMIDADEKEISLSPVIHILDVSLAPAGADLGQIKPQVKPLTPDISGLRLVD